MNREIRNALFTITVLIVAVVMLYLLYHVRGVIPPIIFGAVIAYLLLPITNFLSTKKIPRSLSSLIALLIFFVTIVILGYFLIPLITKELIDLVNKLPNLQENITAFLKI